MSDVAFRRFSAWLVSLFALCCAGPAFAQAWQARHNLTPAEYQSAFDSLGGQGYRLTAVSGYVKNGERYAALWVKTAGPPLVARHGLSSGDYQAAFDDYTKQGYRLIYVSGYEVGGNDKYAAIWEKKAGPAWTARHGLSSADYQSAFDKLTKDGYRLLHVSGYTKGGAARFAAIFEKSAGPVWVARHDLSAGDYQSAFEAYSAQGYRLKVVSGYRVGGADRYAAIWHKSGSLPWSARHAVPELSYQSVFDNYYFSGHRMIGLSAFASGNTARFNGIWENPSFKAQDLALIANKANGYLSSNGVPGMAFAITRNGKLVYASGFGKADSASGEEAGATSLFRIASVSKPLTATAIMKLVEQNKLGLGDKLFGPGGILSSKFPTPAGNQKIEKITVKHLLEHVSGFHNQPSDPMFQNTTYTHTQLIDWVLKAADRKVTRNPEALFEYLNFGYCLLGRVIEQKSGKSYEAFVKQAVLAPAGVTGMSIGGNSAAEKRAREVHYYPASAYDLNVRRFDAHGGWLATPIDLVRFLVRVDGSPTKPDIISAQSLASMTTKAGIKDKDGMDPNYAFGWNVSPHSHNGIMSGTSAIMAVSSNGFTFAAVANKRPDSDQWASKLAQVARDVIAGVSAWPSHDLF